MAFLCRCCRNLEDAGVKDGVVNNTPVDPTLDQNPGGNLTHNNPNPDPSMLPYPISAATGAAAPVTAPIPSPSSHGTNPTPGGFPGGFNPTVGPPGPTNQASGNSRPLPYGLTPSLDPPPYPQSGPKTGSDPYAPQPAFNPNFWDYWNPHSFLSTKMTKIVVKYINVLCPPKKVFASPFLNVVQIFYCAQTFCARLHCVSIFTFFCTAASPCNTHVLQNSTQQQSVSKIKGDQMSTQKNEILDTIGTFRPDRGYWHPGDKLQKYSEQLLLSTDK